MADGSHLYSEVPISSAIDDLSDDQSVAVAESILKMCTRQSEKRPMSEGNWRAFDTANNPTLTRGGLFRTKKTAKAVFEKLIADFHYDINEIQEIKEAIEDYYD